MGRFLLFSLGIHLLLIWRLSPPNSTNYQIVKKNKKIFFIISPKSAIGKKEKSKRIKNIIHQIQKTKYAPSKSNSKSDKTTSSSSQATTKISTSDQIQNGLHVVSLPLTYPYQAIKQHQEGTVIIKLTLVKGKITDFTIQQSSGYQLLDRAVINALQEAKLRHNTDQTTTMTLAFKFQL